MMNNGSILNANGYQNRLAPGAVFVIFGSGLGPPSIATAASPNYPLSLGGTSVSLAPAAGGATVPAKMVYSVAGQIAGLLPSSIAPGTYAATVTVKEPRLSGRYGGSVGYRRRCGFIERHRWHFG